MPNHTVIALSYFMESLVKTANPLIRYVTHTHTLPSSTPSTPTWITTLTAERALMAPKLRWVKLSDEAEMPNLLVRGGRMRGVVGRVAGYAGCQNLLATAAHTGNDLSSASRDHCHDQFLGDLLVFPSTVRHKPLARDERGRDKC